ncbi:dirigent protein 1-like [Oryza brachyantha]|uniref:Dirigent protein n=1 Tax=Oryza brachyantha TaxID=4533 RepID=J3MN02_ORYBR|nr:dirigent protein 1-like [Oryza brachyantha]
MASSSSLLLFFLLVLASSAAGDDGGKLTRIRVYMHETFAGPNATALAVVQSPLGASETFGRVAVLDDELRDGPDPASSRLVGRYQGIFAGTALPGTQPGSFQSAITFVFTAGGYGGSTVTMVGPVLGFTGGIERALVGGTGAFRMARGYCVMTAVATTAKSVVYEADLFVLMYEA